MNKECNFETPGRAFDEKQRKRYQHEIKVHMEKYFKEKLGKGVDYTKVVLWDDMLIIRGERFLTEPEKYIVQTEDGVEVVRAARMHVCLQHALDNDSYFEELLGAKITHETYDVDARQDFWIHVMVFDRNLTLETVSNDALYSQK